MTPDPIRAALDWKARELPVTPDTVTVLGYRVNASCPSWRGLDFSRAQVLEHATILSWFMGSAAPADHHLNVPFAHPDDDAEMWDGVMYRVRPRRKGWRFHQAEGGAWVLRRVERAAKEGSDGR